MNYTDVPIWEKYTLTIEEAAKYFRIGEKKLRQLAEENPNANWLIMNGNRVQIKRKQFENHRLYGGHIVAASQKNGIIVVCRIEARSRTERSLHYVTEKTGQ